MLALLALIAPVLAANPFASAGAAGVGEGWKTPTAALVGSKLRLEDGALRLDANGTDGADPKACLATRLDVASRVRIHGKWKTQGIEAAQGWQGGRLVVRFFDQAGAAIKGNAGTVAVVSGRGNRAWEDITKVLDAPAGAAKADLCVEMLDATAGTAWFKDLELAPKGQDTNAKNVLWLVIDTLRADALGTYGQARPLSPNIDALAKTATVYEKAWAQYTWTNPSVISHFTSQYTRSHGWEHEMGQVEGMRAISPRVTTVAEVLARQGYLTQGFYANGYMKPEIGFGRGFHTWSYKQDPKVVALGLEDIARWSADGAPNFLYLHLMTMHVPLRPSAAGQKAAGVNVAVPADGVDYYARAKSSLSIEDYSKLFRDAYMGSVLDADAYVGQVIEALRAAGQLENTMIILSSDHGELLGEHGQLGHGNFVYEELTSTPLIVRVPGGKAARVADRVGQNIDIAPTILDWLGAEQARPATWQGVSLLDAAPKRLAVSERSAFIAYTTDGRWKTVEADTSGKLLEAYDLSKKPLESTNLVATPTPEHQALQSAAQLWRGMTVPFTSDGPLLQMTQEQRDQTEDMLKELGYIE
mgnify:CR=1 FL=1